MTATPKDIALAIEKSSTAYKMEDPIWREYDKEVRELTRIANLNLGIKQGEPGYIWPTAIWSLLNMEYKRLMLDTYRTYCTNSSNKNARRNLITVRSISRIPADFEVKYQQNVLQTAMNKVRDLIEKTREAWY